MNAGLYMRVSTSEQSVEMQRADLRQYCEQRGFAVFHEYSDEGVSGAKDRRPALDHLMADAKKRRFDTVLVWRFDRFARSTKHLISALDEFNHLGIAFISYQENIDTSSPLGKAMFTIVSAIAELERNIIIERIKGSIANAKARGVRMGRRPIIDEHMTQRILQLNRDEKSIREIARALNISKSAVHKSLKVSRAKHLDKSGPEGHEKAL